MKRSRGTSATCGATIVGALCFLCFFTDPASAVVTVPGDFPTLQAVADWQRENHVDLDTVRVLPDVPFEPATFWHRGLGVLIGQPDSSGTLPRIGKLELFDNGRTQVQSLHVDGPVHYAWCDPVFRGCRIDSTITWLGQSDPGGITLVSCTLNGAPAINAYQYVVLDSCRVNGQVIVRSLADGNLVARHCVFTGPGLYAIDAYITGGSEVVGNIIRGFDNGIYAGADGTQFPVRDNLIEDCPGTGIVAGPFGYPEITGNVIRRCGTGIDIQHADADVIDNLVVDCLGDGIRVRPDIWGRARIERNIVTRSGANGFVISGEQNAEVLVRNNTSVANASNGFILHDAFVFDHNIAYANRGFGVLADSLHPPVTECNDWFANDAGDVRGLSPAPSDRSVEPGFCDVAQDNFHLMTDSPLRDAPGCGLIGALGVGCGATPVLVALLRAVPAIGGVRIEWQWGGIDRPLESSIERADDVAGPWGSVVTERRFEGGITVDWDRHVEAGRTYFYRLAWTAKDGERAVSEMISATLPGVGAFALKSVGPNPSSGRVEIAWSLPRSGEVELVVFDVAGREVARLATGHAPAGNHMSTWNGLAAPGLYLVRLRHDGRELSRRVFLRR